MAYELKNEKVAALVGVEFTGNIIPTTWYSWIKRDTSWFSKGKGNVVVDIIAINILAEILYWYRPVVLRSDDLKEEIVKQKFSGDLLQKNYKQISEKFGITEKQVRDGMTTLEKNGLIERIFVDKCYGAGVIRNVIYVDINIEKVKDISSRLPEDKDFDGGYCLISQYVLTKSVTRVDQLGTHTKIPTQTTSESSLLSKDNEPNGSVSNETDESIIRDIANNKEEILLDNLSLQDGEAILQDNQAEFDISDDIDIEHIEQAIASNTMYGKPKKKARKIANRKISEFCKEQAKKLGVSCIASDQNGVQHFQSNKFKELMELGGCDDMFCMIVKLIEGNLKLGQYAYDISTPQKLYSNSAKIYNSLVKNGKRDEENNPAKQWFEEFYNTYPKKEGRDQGESWYLTFVKKKENHDEIMKGTKVFVSNIEKEGKELDYIKSANKYLEERRWRDYLLDEIPDSSIRQKAYDMGDAMIYADHLNSKYGPDRTTEYGEDYSQLKLEIVQKGRVK